MIEVRRVSWCVLLFLFAFSIPICSAQGVINVNTATKEELMMLPGIGEKTAISIVEYRKANGQFKSIDDMTKVKGISKRKLEKLRPSIVLSGQNTYIPPQSPGNGTKNASKKKQ